MYRKFQVFISSTYTDLISERQAAVEAILQAGHIPAGMELFSAGSEPQLDIIKRWIDESDIYMLILGSRYGSIEPKSQLSYCEVEYRHALASDKPFFALVMDESIVRKKILQKKTTSDSENLNKLDEFRRFVTSKMCSIFKDR